MSDDLSDVKIQKSSETTNKTIRFIVSIFLKIRTKQTNSDINGHIRTNTDIAASGCCIFAL